MQRFASGALWFAMRIMGAHKRWLNKEVYFGADGRPQRKKCSAREFNGGKAGMDAVSKLLLHFVLDAFHALSSAWRFIVLVYLIMAKRGTWTLEQPVSSLVNLHRRFKQLVLKHSASWIAYTCYKSVLAVAMVPCSC